MLTTLALSPVLLSVALILGLKQSALRAGFAGLAVTLLLIAFVPPFSLSLGATGAGLVHGLLITLPVALVLLGAVCLSEVLIAGGALDRLGVKVAQLILDDRHRLFGLVFGLSVFFESATGFGVGIVVVAPLFIVIGFDPMRAAVLALIGHCAVPFGALAVGTVLGSDLSGISETRLGELAVLLSMPYLVVSGAAALWVAGLARRGPGAVVWVVIYSSLLAVSLWLGSIWVGVELSGCVAGLVVLTFAWCVDRKPAGHIDVIDEPGTRRPSFAASVVPLAALILALAVTRLMPALRDALVSFLRVEIDAFGFTLSPIHHSGFWLLASALVGVFSLRLDPMQVKSVVRTSARRWLMATLAITGFIVFGNLMSVSGMTVVLAQSVAAATSSAYIVAIPVIGALGGFLTASNAASNAMFMALQMQAGEAAGISPELTAAAQNASGSNVTMASPGRIVFAAAVVDQAGAESTLMRRVLPIAIAGVVGCILMAVVLQRIGHI